MPPTIITSFVLVVFAIAVVGYTVRLWFGDWETRYPRRFVEVDDTDGIDGEVAKLRREIEDWERRNAA